MCNTGYYTLLPTLLEPQEVRAENIRKRFVGENTGVRKATATRWQVAELELALRSLMLSRAA